MATIFFFMSSGPAMAQNFKASVVSPTPVEVHRGQVGEVEINLGVDAPWYFYAPTGVNAEQGLIETRLVMQSLPEIQFADPEFPAAQSHGAYDILTGKTNVVRLSFRIHPMARKGDYPVEGSILYQTCNGRTCLPPARAKLEFTIHVLD